MTLASHIDVNPRIMLGKPVIRGTRIPVELILRKLGEGASEQDLLDAYPHLKSQDIRAAMSYVAKTFMRRDMLHVALSSSVIHQRHGQPLAPGLSVWFGTMVIA